MVCDAMVNTGADATRRPTSFDSVDEDDDDDGGEMNEVSKAEQDTFQHNLSMCKIASDPEGLSTFVNEYEQDWNPHAVVGARACIHGRTRDKDGVTFYDVEVKASDREWVVKRRYRDFELLTSSLLGIGGVRPMPPKSIFRHRMSTSFNDARQEQLNEVLRTVCAADPQLSRLSVLHSFLGLDGVGAAGASGNSVDLPCEGAEEVAMAHVEGALAGHRPRNLSGNSDLWQHSYCGASQDSGESEPETFPVQHSGAADMSAMAPSRSEVRRNSM